MKKLISIAGIGLLIVMITSILPVFALKDSNWGELQGSVSDKTVTLTVVTFGGLSRDKDFSGKAVTSFVAKAYSETYDEDSGQFVHDPDADAVLMNDYITNEAYSDSQVKLSFDIDGVYSQVEPLYDADGNMIDGGQRFYKTGVTLYVGSIGYPSSNGPGFAWRRR